MSKAVLIIGPSGAGKSTSIRTLNPETTFIFNCLAKDLPWKGSAKQYTYWDKENNPKGNALKTNKSRTIITWLDHIDKNMPHIKDIIIDDNTFLTSLELLSRSKETTWDKFTDVAQNLIDIANKSKQLREDLNVYVLHHTQQSGDGILEEVQTRAMSYGKLVDEKLGTIEAQFTIVLRAAKEKDKDNIRYCFYVNDANSSAKSPDGMFADNTIPNDLALVRHAIDCYYNNDCN